MSDSFSQHQLDIYQRGLRGQTLPHPIKAAELEASAKSLLPLKVYDYVAGGAGRESTIAANLAAFNKWAILPRVLRDISRRDYRLELFGTSLAAPLVLAPIGQLGAVHPQGDVAAARAAGALGIPFVLSTVSSSSIEAVAENAGDGPRWFHLYWPNDPELTRSLLGRAEAAGYKLVMVTLDTRLLGWRERDLQHGHLPFAEGEGLANYTSDPVFRRRLKDPHSTLAAFQEMSRVFADLRHRWPDLKQLRELTRLPIVLKGILHPEDARFAVDAGVDGLIVSNHGGRQIDGSIAALEALPAVVAQVAGQIPVLFDSGIRGGADIVKALALGAKAVMLGRPYVWGLAVGGEEGVGHVLRNLLAEFDLTMALSGVCRLDQVAKELLQRVG